MQAAILAIGDELVLGQTVDTNTAYIAAKLTEIGCFPAFHMTVDDDLIQIAEAFTHLIARYEIILVTGGLGPTEDDLTRDGLAKSLGSELVFHEAAWQEIQSFFTQLGKSPTENNRSQAMLPVGAAPIDNPKGTAPGIHLTSPSQIFVMPGVPREMKGMMADYVLPEIQKLEANRHQFIKTCKVNTFGLGESSLAEKLGELLSRTNNDDFGLANVTMGTTVSQGIVSVRIRVIATEEAEAAAAMTAAIDQLKVKLGDLYFGLDDETLQEVVIRLAREKKVKISVAESCTAGLIGAFLGEVPGASEALEKGYITYANTAKMSLLGVSEQLLDQYGAVSIEVAREMAEGAATSLSGKSDQKHLAVSVTGIAGPGGGSDDKPVGTICFGVCSQVSGKRKTETYKHLFPASPDKGSRNVVRDRSAKTALNYMRLRLMHAF